MKTELLNFAFGWLETTMIFSLKILDWIAANPLTALGIVAGIALLDWLKRVYDWRNEA